MKENYSNSILDSVYKIEEEDLIVKENELSADEEVTQVTFESEYLDIKVEFVIFKSEEFLEKEILERIKASSLYLPSVLGICNYSSLGHGLVLEKVKGKKLYNLINDKETSFEERIDIIYCLISMFDFSNSRNSFFKNLILKDLIFDKKSEKLYISKCPINQNENSYSIKQIMNIPPEFLSNSKSKNNPLKSVFEKEQNIAKLNDIAIIANENSNSWILGLLIAEILEGKHLFFTGNESESEILTFLSGIDPKFIVSRINSLPYNQYLKNILKKLLKIDPKQRSNLKLIKQKFDKNLIMTSSKILKTQAVRDDFNDTAFLIKNEASLMDLSRDLNFNVTINNDSVYIKRKFSEEINLECNNNFIIKNILQNERDIIEEDIIFARNSNVEQTGITTTSIRVENNLNEENSLYVNLEERIDDKIYEMMSPFKKEKKEEVLELKEIFQKQNENNEDLIKRENEQNLASKIKQDSEFIQVNETNNENLIQEVEIKEIREEEKQMISLNSNNRSIRDMMELNKIFSKPEKTITDRLEELANDYHITNSERYLEEIQDILNNSQENITTEKTQNFEIFSKNLWDTIMLIAFKHLDNDDLKSHYIVSTLLYTTVDKVYSDNHLKIGLAKFHYAKCMKDYSCIYSLSLNLFLESLNLLEKANETESKLGIQVKFFLGNLYTDMGMSEESIYTLRDVLQKQIKLFGEEHSFTARTYNCLGIAEDNRCNYRQAREYYQKSYTLFKLLSYGLETIDSAKVLNNLAGIYFKWDDFTSSIKFYLKVLEVYMNKYGENCSYVGITYYNLGNCYLMINNDDKAMDYLKKAKEIFTKELGASHPQTAMSCKNLGDLYYTLNDYKNALELYSQCVNTFLEKFGEDHDLYVSTLGKIKKLKSSLGK